MDPHLQTAAPARRRTWPHRLLIAANVVVAACVLSVATAYGYFHWRYGQIPKIDFGGLLPSADADDVPGNAFNVLLVGSDTRANVSAEERRSFGSTRQVGGQRSDTIIVLRIDPKNERAAMLSIPRDLYVPIVGTQGRCEDGLRCARINSAFEADSPEEGAKNLVATINRAFGIQINHYVQVDFDGFRGLVEAVGGVDMYLPSRVRDKGSGLDIRSTGCVTLDGNLALAWVRSRHFETFESGRWRSDPTGDLGRIQRQQDFIQRALKKAIEKGARNPATLNSLINAGVRNVVIDDGLQPSDMFKIAKRFRNLEPGQVEMFTVPTTPTRINGASVLRLKQPEADQVIDAFLGVPPPGSEGRVAPPPGVKPNQVSVRVLNGSGVGGQATEVSSALSDLGYSVVGRGDADTFKYTASEIRYGRGQKDKALLLQSMVEGRSKLREDATLRGVDVVLITGGEFGGIVAPGQEPPVTARTTAPPQPAPDAEGDPADDQC